MCEFETPIFIYYSYISVIILSLITGFLILLKDKKRPTNRNAFYFILFIVLWIFGDLLQWTIHDKEINMFFAKISDLMILIYLFFLYFSYHFAYRKINWKQKVIYALPFIPLILLIPSKYNLGIFNNECDYTDGPLVYYVYFLELLYSFWSSWILIEYYKNPVITRTTKRQIKILVLAILAYAIWNIAYEELGNRFFMSNATSPYYITCNLFFVSIIAFTMIKKDLFEFQNVLLDWFTVFLWSILFAGLFIFATNPFVMILCAVAYAALLLIFFRM